MIKPTYIPVIAFSTLCENGLLTKDQENYIIESEIYTFSGDKTLITVERFIGVLEEQIEFDDIHDDIIKLKHDHENNEIYIDLEN